MNNDESQFAWWSRLRHSGLLLSPVVQIEQYAEPPEELKWYQPEKLRTAYTRFVASIDRSKDRPQLAQGDILTWVDALLEKYVGHTDQRLARSHSIPESLTAVFRIGSRTETLKPDRILFADDGKTPLLLVKADTSPHIGRGKGRTEYAKFLELLRGSGHRLGLLTNGLQFRLVYAGLDFESWCEWESERWFEDSEGTEELLGLRQLLFPTQATDNKGEVIGAGLPGLLHAVEESRKRQADLSQVLRENVRQAVELLLVDVSTASRTDAELFHALVSPESGDQKLPDAEAHEALMQATVRVVMRMVVCLFAESRGLLPVSDLIYSQSYGVRTLYKLLDETTRHEGSQLGLMDRRSAWPRLMALFRLIHGGSAHGGFTLRPYGGALFRSGKADSPDAVSRALFILEHRVAVNDSTIYRVLKKLLRGPLPVLRGRTKTYVEGPVDYTELRTEFIGLIYEGLLDYRLKRTTDELGPQVFLNLGRNPVLPLSVLEEMLENKPADVKDLFDKLSKEKVTATVSSEDDEDEESDDELPESDDSDEGSTEVKVEKEVTEEELQGQSHLDSVQVARKWARKAIIATKMIGKQKKRETDTDYDKRIEEHIDELIERVVAPGEFYLVRAGNTRKGTGTFYTRPQLAVPTVHRTLEPLCFDMNDDDTLTPKTPQELLALKVCDPACGSASFLVAALHYLTDALYKSLCHHCGLDDPKKAVKITLPFGAPATGKDSEDLVPLPPDDPVRGEEFAERIQTLLRRHVVERCIYGVDINPLAVEFARVSLWVETLNRELPFSFLDHKLKVGNSLVGTWLNHFQDYPIMAWSRLQRESDKKGELKDYSKAIKKHRNDHIKALVRQWIDGNGPQRQLAFPEVEDSVESVHHDIADAFEQLHSLPMSADGIRQREVAYKQRILSDDRLTRLKTAMDAWCCIWFWPPETIESCPLPNDLGTDYATKPQTLAEIRRLASEQKFFHWELEFPDVFHETGSGFDVMLGNPPWDIIKPLSMEFFTEFDPIYRTYSNQDAKREQKTMFARDASIADRWREYLARFGGMSNWVSHAANPTGYHPRNKNKNAPSPFNLMDAGAQWRQSDVYHADWKSMRANHVGFVECDRHPFRLQGSADLNSYKMFMEVCWRLLKLDGRLGIILPTGVYSDLGTKDLREELLTHGRLEVIYAFQNEKDVFVAADHTLRIVSLIATAGGHTDSFAARFRMGVNDAPSAQEIPNDIISGDSEATKVTTADLREFSPRTLSLLELRTSRDFEVFRRLVAHSQRLGDNPSGWTIEYGTDFHMTNDSKLFSPIQNWTGKGYKPDAFGRWKNGEGGVALPVYEGRMIGQFDISQKGWVSGKGRSAVWRSIPFDQQDIEPQYLSDERICRKVVPEIAPPLRVAYMGIGRATVTRTMFATPHVRFPFGNSAPTLTVTPDDGSKTLLLTGVLNSLVFDYTFRQRLAGLNLNWFILEECIVPESLATDAPSQGRIVANTARLTLVHRLFAPNWLILASFHPNLKTDEWKRWWAVTEADRLRLRVESDALVADLYSLEAEDYEWIVRNDPKDAKGFYRVDRDYPFKERLTGLSACAFRALKEGKWSAETAAELSNDEFFEILGIPELTNANAAKAKGHSGPLILKRQGCHSWHPENFPEDDPRHGWTWDDCRKDAIALLGSEEAVDVYIAKATGDGSEGEEDEEPFQLISEPAEKKNPQRTLDFGD